MQTTYKCTNNFPLVRYSMLCNVSAIADWATANGLKLNPKKTKLMFLGNRYLLDKVQRNTIDPIYLNETPISFADSVKNLGILMDQALTGDQWVKQVCRKSFALLSRSYRYGGLWLPVKARRALVNALSMPLLDYGSVLQTGITAASRRKLQ